MTDDPALRVWTDPNGRLRFKLGAPDAATDGYTLSERQARTLLRVAQWANTTEWACRFSHLEPERGQARSDVRLDMRALERKGLLKLVPTFDDDTSLCCGSGRILTATGLEVVSALTPEGE